MERPALFEVRTAVLLHSESAALHTPLGAIELSLAAGSVRVIGPAPDAFRIKPGARVLAWVLPTLNVELLIVDLTPKLPPGMAVHGCQAGLWRVRATSAVDGCVFDARWAPGCVPSSGGPDSGDRLAALTWDDSRIVVSLGAPDAEGLSRYEGAGLALPAEWRAKVGVDDASLVMIEEFMPDGLCLSLPGLGVGEVGQIHFAVAWADNRNQAVAPWFAVDVSPLEILSVLASGL